MGGFVSLFVTQPNLEEILPKEEYLTDCKEEECIAPQSSPAFNLMTTYPQSFENLEPILYPLEESDNLEIPFYPNEEHGIPQIVPLTDIQEDPESLRDKLKELGF